MIDANLGRLYSIIETTLIKSAKEDKKMQLCFNASSTILMYTLVPGKKIFISNYHPHTAIEPVLFTGQKFFKVNVNTKVTQWLSDDTCSYEGSDIHSVFSAHKKYEIW